MRPDISKCIICNIINSDKRVHDLTFTEIVYLSHLKDEDINGCLPMFPEGIDGVPISAKIQYNEQCQWHIKTHKHMVNFCKNLFECRCKCKEKKIEKSSR